MFFDNPPAAFAHLARIAAPGARLVFSMLSCSEGQHVGERDCAAAASIKARSFGAVPAGTICVCRSRSCPHMPQRLARRAGRTARFCLCGWFGPESGCRCALVLRPNRAGSRCHPDPARHCAGFIRARSAGSRAILPCRGPGLLSGGGVAGDCDRRQRLTAHLVGTSRSEGLKRACYTPSARLIGNI